jgi:hypothetical protein
MKPRPLLHEDLLEELRQIVAQYQAEIPGGRKAWPNAIKHRVARLKELGLSFKAISDQTGLPYFTVLGWRDYAAKANDAGQFRQVSPDAAFTAATVAVATLSKDLPAAQGRVSRNAPEPAALPPSAAVTTTATVTVTTPEGFRVEGLSFPQAVDLLGKFQ